ncbi:MAG: type I-E CRISPR-associated protein Cas6/Cse3/CasE [Chloracidobacterium sp.]|uniref:Type I-E CRISPR-associated protein Cas6/Cse3/CasE n=1 Tax=Chloracidobacterium validum TaxID=2821543 RepID=A0ABX8BB01_9BACT|nr:type I-E CRISPR-associated protein Cas6/Cse3/CasE [Chloracidobacterium validum]QUW04038.1 type I-E CRISPR-associated protein Cas6/Cse3/CasE [Chloracidobacterium validum]
MIYLSQLTLNPTNRHVFRLLRTPYHTHAAIMRAFPPGDRPAEGRHAGNGRVLFRVEPARPATGPWVTVLVQSLTAPNWEPLRAELGASLHVEQRSLEPKFRVGQQFRFRLRANPTVRCHKAEGNRKPGQRYGIYGEEPLFKWLVRKGNPPGGSNRGGFSVAKGELWMVDEGHWTAWREAPPALTEADPFQADGGAKKLEKTGQSLTIHTVLFEGRLTVTQPDAFVETLKFGIGSAKGFGCGLLSLARR